MPKPHSVPDIREWQAEAWRGSAERAENRNQPVRARYFRNLAWEFETGQTWFEYIKTLEDQNGATVRSAVGVPEPRVPAHSAAGTNPNTGDGQ